MRSALANLPLVFEPNRGQADPQVSFLARGGGYTLFLTRREAVMALSGSAPIRIRPSCAQEPQAINGLEPTGGISNYFIGNDPAHWTTGVPNYRKVQYTSVCPGVDVTYYGNPQKLEYDFTLSAWTDPRTVQMEYEGAESVRLAANGDLLVKTASGELVQHKPRAYQVIGGRQVQVEAGYRLTKGNRIEFALARYDREQPLVIDPVLVYSTYLGGTGVAGQGGDSGRSIAVDPLGNAYVTGKMVSVDFPTVNPMQPSNAGSSDAFVAKISPDGRTEFYATYLGGALADAGLGIAVDSSGNAYVTGQTSSANFPVTSASAFQPFLSASSDAFVTKLNPSGSALLYSTYLGGTGVDQGTGITVDNIGNAYVAGSTSSVNFPFKAGALQTSNHSTIGQNNAFVTKLNTTLTGAPSEVYSTYLGGTASDEAFAIAIDTSSTGCTVVGAACACVTGSATSSDFPVIPGSFLTVKPSVSPHQSAFVTKLNAGGTGLMFFTYLGGTGDDFASGIAVNATGNYVTGTASSSNFPVVNPKQTTFGGGITDAFVTKLNPAGTALVYSTYLGGLGTDVGNGISVDSSGTAYVVGSSTSSTTSLNFPLSPSPLFSTGFIFVSALNPAGNSFAYSTLLSGGSADAGLGIAATPTGTAYVTGLTNSSSFPILNAVQPTLGGGNGGPGNAFVTVISPPLAGVPSVVALSPTSGSAPSQTFTFTFSDTAGAANLDFVQVLFSQSGSGSGACWIFYSRQFNLVDLYNDGATAAVGPAPPGSATILHNSQCTLDVGATTVTLAGTQLTVVMPVTFPVSFAGPKQIFLRATNTQQATSGWQVKGNWTVGSATVPSVVALSPASGSGFSQTFMFTYSDTGGASNLDFVQVLFSQAGSGSGACWIHYSRRFNLADLINDGATAAVGPAPPGFPTVLHNSQCALDIGATSVTSAGTQVTVVMPVTFQPGFAGTKQVFLRAINLQQLNTGWEILGSWIVP